MDEVVPPHPGYRPAASSVHYTSICNTQSSAPEDGRNYRPKHVELIGIINKTLLLHLVGCLYYCGGQTLRRPRERVSDVHKENTKTDTIEMGWQLSDPVYLAQDVD